MITLMTLTQWHNQRHMRERTFARNFGSKKNPNQVPSMDNSGITCRSPHLFRGALGKDGSQSDEMVAILQNNPYQRPFLKNTLSSPKLALSKMVILPT